MSSEIGIIITNAGFAEVVNAEKTGTAPVVMSKVGFGTGQYTASADQTSLVSEFKKLNTIAGGVTDSNIMHVTVNDGSADDYAVYEIGVYTASGTLFAVYSQTTPIVQKVALSEIMLAIDIALTNVNPASVTIGDTDFSLAPATVSRAGVVELATNAETITGTDSTRAVTPAGLASLTATTGRRGLVELATLAELKAGTATDKAVTPGDLATVFAADVAATGWQRLSSGLIVQWGSALIAPGGTAVFYPTIFSSDPFVVVAQAKGSHPGVGIYNEHTEKGKVIFNHNADGGVTVDWIAIGE